MIKITKQQYENTSNDYKGPYMDVSGARPDLKGNKSLLTSIDGKPTLLVEGLNLEIVESEEIYEIDR